MTTPPRLHVKERIQKRKLDQQNKYKKSIHEELEKYKRQIQKKPCSEELKKEYSELIETPYDLEHKETFVQAVSKIERTIFNLDKKVEQVTLFIHHMNKLAQQLNNNEIFFEKRGISIQLILEEGQKRIEKTEIKYGFHVPENYFSRLIRRAIMKGKKRIFIPLLMRIGDEGEGHGNLLVLEIDPSGINHQVFRYEPNMYMLNKDNHGAILFKSINDYLTDYFEFNEPNITYAGFPRNACSVDHGGLCRYVGFVQYIFGKKISYPNLKLFILKYLYDIISDYCNLYQKVSFGKRVKRKSTLGEVNKMLKMLENI